MALTFEQLKRLRRNSSKSSGNRIRAARELCGLTQVQLAEAIGITQGSLSDLERQRYGGITVDTARRFSGFFGCSIEDLFPASETVTS